jgi:hypothetical protein
MLTLSYVDDGDGAATVTIGGTGGAAVTLLASQWSGSLGASAAWSEAGTRAGDGEIEIELATGYHWLLAITASDRSNPVYARLASTAESTWDRVLDHVVTRIQALDLPGIGSRVVRHKWPDATRFVSYEANVPSTLPAVIVAGIGGEQILNEYNQADVVGYRVAVILFDDDRRDQTLNFSRNTQWRESILRAFLHQGGPGGDSPVYDCQLDQGATNLLLPERWVRGVWQQNIGLLFRSVDPRGFGA